MMRDVIVTVSCSNTSNLTFFNSACVFVYAGTYTPTTHYKQTYDNKDVITLGLNIKLSTTCFQSPEHDGLIRIAMS